MQPKSHKPSAPLPAPFLFKGHSELLSELDVDAIYRTRPATAEEAKELGYLYPKLWNPNDPHGSIEKAMGGYRNLTDRHIFFVVHRRGDPKRCHVIQDANSFKAYVEFPGLLEYFYKSAERYLSAKGASDQLIEEKLYGVPLKENDDKAVRVSRWVLGYERSTGNTTIIDCTNSLEFGSLFLVGRNDVRTPDLGR